MNKWDVVLLAFPFTDLSTSKRRPGLIISPPSFHNSGEDAIFVMITSNTNGRHAQDFMIEASHPDFARTGLYEPSLVRVTRIMTLSKSLIKRRLGSFGPSLIAQTDQNLKGLLGL